MSGSHGGCQPTRPADQGDERYLAEIVRSHVGGQPVLRRARPRRAPAEDRPAPVEAPSTEAAGDGEDLHSPEAADAPPPAPEDVEGPAPAEGEEPIDDIRPAPTEAGPARGSDGPRVVEAGPGGARPPAEDAAETLPPASAARPNAEGIVSPAEMAMLSGDRLPAEGDVDPPAEALPPEPAGRRRWGGLVRLVIQLLVVAALAGLAVLLHLLTR